METDLASLIAYKEKELQEITKMRFVQLEEENRKKSVEIKELVEKMQTIQEDFNYNVKLIDDRDAELLELEMKFEEVRKVMKLKDSEISELRAMLASTEFKMKNENSKIRNQEIVLIEARDQLREELAEVKWRKEEEVRNLKTQIEEIENSSEKMLRAKEKELNEARILTAQKFEKAIRQEKELFEEEKSRLLCEIEEKAAKIIVLSRDRKELQERLQEVLAEDKIAELEKEYTSEIRRFESLAVEKDLQVSKLIDHSKHLAQQMELLKSQLQSESEYAHSQKEFYEKELSKFKTSHEEELRFIKESNEIQISRLNSTYTLQINRLQQRIAASEEEAEKAYIQSQQLREKTLGLEKKAAAEADKIEESWKKDLKIAEEGIRVLRADCHNKETEIKTLQESLGGWKARCEQYAEESKRLRISAQELEIELSALKNEVFRIKDSKNTAQEVGLIKLKDLYEAQIKDLTQELEFFKAKSGIDQAERQLKKSGEFPKLWSEDYGPASSIKSSESRGLAQENEELKRIIEDMRIEMEAISKNPGRVQEDLRQSGSLQRLRSELVRVTAERDQLLEISSELKAELREIKAAQDGHGVNFGDFEGFQHKSSDRVEELAQRNPTRVIPRYDEFENIEEEMPEKLERPEKKFIPINSNRETQSQKEVFEKYRANLKKAKRPQVKNYNNKD